MKKNIKIGKKLFTLTSDDIYLEHMGNEFEPFMAKLFQSLIAPKDIVADVGANIGMTAILFSGLAKKVYAFEPSPTTFSILKKKSRFSTNRKRRGTQSRFRQLSGEPNNHLRREQPIGRICK